MSILQALVISETYGFFASVKPGGILILLGHRTEYSCKLQELSILGILPLVTPLEGLIVSVGYNGVKFVQE